MSKSLLPIVTQDDNFSLLTMVDSVNAHDLPDFNNSDSASAPQPPPMLVDIFSASCQPEFSDSDCPVATQPTLPPTIHPFFLSTGLTTEVTVSTKPFSTKPISVRSHFRNGKKVTSHKRNCSVSKARKASKTKSKNKPKLDWENRPDARLLILKHQLDVKDP